MSAIVDQLSARLPPRSWTADPDLIASHLVEWRGLYRGAATFMAMPDSTEEVAAIVGACAEAGVPITPQGGNTGLVGAQIPNGEILLSLKRMNKIRSVSAEDDALVAEAGVVLKTVQEAAAEAGRVFPLSLGSEGSATIGGLISTNAGGVHVIRFGMMREQVLGLEVVLPDGRVLPALKALRKDNTGYDLKHLFIGAEGTLGIITAATLKLQPRAAEHVVALVGLASPGAALKLLHYMKVETGAVVAFELMNPFATEMTLGAFPQFRDPLPNWNGWRVLIEMESIRAVGLRDAAEQALAGAMEKGLIQDAVVAENHAHARDLWRIREEIPAAQRTQGAQASMDISVPVARVPDFLRDAEIEARKLVPELRVLAFGHAGDGNIHYTVMQPPGPPNGAFWEKCVPLVQIVQDVAVAMGGSISAEHGIGVSRREELPRYKDEVALDVMARVKAALDPKRIMNPRSLT
ncbi:MAG: FAD-binding oxidoreductase [Pseudomonadota bacterium]